MTGQPIDKTRPRGVGAGRRCAIALWVVGLFAGSRLESQERWRTLDDFLARGIGLEASQLAALSHGEAVSKLMPTSDQRDVAVFGAVQVNVPRSYFITRQTDFPGALRNPGRSVAGLFGSPAGDADVRTLDITAEDMKRLRACRANSCDFKLPATDMDRLRTTTDWAAPDARASVLRYARQRMVDLVNDYTRRGNAAMVAYDDRGSVRGSDALTAMLRDSSYAFRIAPSFGRHLLEYPRDSLAGATEVIFWSIDEMPHVRPTLRITHEVVYSPPELPGTTILAMKQIYANHYFEAGLEVLSAVDRHSVESARDDGGITLVAIRRYRFDNLPSGGPLSLRDRVANSLREQVVADLTRLKADSERARRTPGER